MPRPIAFRRREVRSIRAILVVFGVLAAVAVGTVTLFKLGEVFAIEAVLVVLAVAIGGLFAAPHVTRALAGLVVVLFIAAGAYVAIQAASVVSALTNTDGPVDPADPAALAAAKAKVDAVEDSAGFRLELTDSEITAYVLDGLQGNADNPLRRVDIDITGAEPDGKLNFEALFKSGDLSASGSLAASLEAGSVKVELTDIEVGSLSMPGVGRDALEDLIESLTDLNETLEEHRADVQSISVGNDRIVVTGIQAGTDLITADALLSSISDQVGAASAATAPPPERLGPGVVDGTSADGPTYYVALGDSLASNFGAAARDGYVSRLHRALQERDGATYGLRNFAVSGESSGTLIRTGQLDAAIDFMRSNSISYVTIDIGGNDLLGHLGEADCSTDIESASCRERIAASLVAYEGNMTTIFDDLVRAAPDASILLLETYNPFSFGFAGAVVFEAESDRAIADMNAIAVRLAQERGIIAADGFSPMMGTVAATTHMADSPPDIHPTPIGFDVLASALFDSLG
jgi:lysophospholipase L1-like esterase